MCAVIPLSIHVFTLTAINIKIFLPKDKSEWWMFSEWSNMKKNLNHTLIRFDIISNFLSFGHSRYAL